MTTKRRQSTAVGRDGVNFVRAVVERANCLFQQVELENDVGVDAYIEFIVAEDATGCVVATQIKSGPSYISAKGNLILKANRDHFEYWNSHVLPVAGIVVDPRSGRAGWCDISSYLRENPRALSEGPFQIAIGKAHEFSNEGFDGFRLHFLRQRRRFSDDAHFGRALDRFSPFHPPHERVDAVQSLFSFHRNRAATWCYIASLSRSVEDHDLLALVVRALAHLTPHPDISWRDSNEIDLPARQGGLDFIRATFGVQDVAHLLSVVDEEGFARGHIGQDVHLLINETRNPLEVLRSIAFDPSTVEDIRYLAIVLFVFYAQEVSVDHCIEELQRFRAQTANGMHARILGEIVLILREHGAMSFY